MAYYKIPAQGGGSSGKAFTAMTADAPDVVAIWNFDEASGPFIDEVNSLEFDFGTEGNATGSGDTILTEHQKNQEGLLKNIAPGVAYTEWDYLTATGLGTDLNPGTGSFTIEAYCQVATAASNEYLFCNEISDAASDDGAFLILRHGARQFRGRVYATDGTFVTCDTATSLESALRACNMETFHARLVYDTDGSTSATIKMYVNGELLKTENADSLAGKTITLNNWWLGVFTGSAGLIRFRTFSILQLRVSHNATNDGYELA